VLRLPHEAVRKHISQVTMAVQLNSTFHSEDNLGQLRAQGNNTELRQTIARLLTFVRLCRTQKNSNMALCPCGDPNRYDSRRQYRRRHNRNSFADPCAACVALRAPLNDSMSGSLMHWQSKFTGLRKLTINVEVTGCLSSAARKVLDELFDSAVFPLRAGNTTVGASVDGCKLGAGVAESNEIAGCDGRCAMFVERAFMRMVDRA